MSTNPTLKLGPKMQLFAKGGQFLSVHSLSMIIATLLHKRKYIKSIIYNKTNLLYNIDQDYA